MTLSQRKREWLDSELDLYAYWMARYEHDGKTQAAERMRYARDGFLLGIRIVGGDPLKERLYTEWERKYERERAIMARQ